MQADKDVVAVMMKRAVCKGATCEVVKYLQCIKCENEIFDVVDVLGNTATALEKLRTDCLSPTACTDASNIWKFKKQASQF